MAECGPSGHRAARPGATACACWVAASGVGPGVSGATGSDGLQLLLVVPGERADRERYPSEVTGGQRQGAGLPSAQEIAEMFLRGLPSRQEG